MSSDESTDLPKFSDRAPLTANGIAFLDLARAAAANLVLMDHAFLVEGIPSHGVFGSMGVMIFFILSGFLINMSSIVRVRTGGKWFYLYLIDRSSRIFTGYIPALIMVALVNELIDLGKWGQIGINTGVWAFLGNLFLMQDYPLFQLLSHTSAGWARIRAYNTAEPFWTIPIEFWIYVVYALVFFCFLKRELVNRFVIMILAIVALPVGLYNVAAGGGNGLSIVWIMGALCGYAWINVWCNSDKRAFTGIILAVCSVVCLTGRALKVGWNFQDIGMVFCAVLAFFGALAFIDCAPRLPPRIRVACTYVASYSYSLYLTHNTVFIIVEKFVKTNNLDLMLTTMFLAAHLFGIAFFFLFERHYKTISSLIKNFTRENHSA